MSISPAAKKWILDPPTPLRPSLPVSDWVPASAVSDATKGKAKQNQVELKRPTLYHFGTPLHPVPLPVSDQRLEELANEMRKWTPPTVVE